jgi:hypothetical protein
LSRYTYAKDATGGLKLTFALTAAEADALGSEELGPDAVALGELFDTVLWTLGMLRTGTVPGRVKYPVPSVEDWHEAIENTFVQLLPRLQGLGDATLRIARGLDMSIALAMDVPRSTAQSRVRKITSQPASEFERWALNGEVAAAMDRFGPMAPDPGLPENRVKG